MPLTTALWLALLVVLGLLFVLTIRRMSALIARTRELERFQGAVDSLDHRFSGVVQPLVQALDETRRHASDPATLRQQLADAQAVLTGLQVETRALAAPKIADAVVAALAGDVDRAVRAAALVEHGLTAMANTSLGRDLEAQTSLKRAALNLRHARDAFGMRAREVTELRPADLAPGAAARRTVAAPLRVYPAGEPEDLEGGFDPRM